MVKAMMKASLIASAVFAAAWIRLPLSASTILQTFLLYGIAIAVFSMLLGLPLASFIERQKIGRWWSYLPIATVSGALLGALLSSHPEGRGMENPFALTFSPWTRASPGFAGTDPPIQWRDYGGTIAFGAIVGGVLGISFWYFYKHRSKS